MNSENSANRCGSEWRKENEEKGGSGASCLERREDLNVKCPIPKPLAELGDRNAAAQATQCVL